MPQRLKSRKFWFAFIGAVLPIVAQYLTNEVALADALQLSAAIVVSYIWGQAYQDGKAAEAPAAVEAE